MKHSDVTMVRVYLTEGEALLKTLLAKLHDEEKVRGVTVFRGISGFGRSGVVHSSTLLDLSLDLPVIIEFFDAPGKVRRILTHLKDSLPPGHVVSWPAQVNEG
jgi:PII-like signaling protein